MARSQIRGGQIKDDSVTGDDVDESTLIITHLEDADNDTKIQVEKTSDEDKIRFDTDGVERMIITETGKVGIGNNITPGYKLDVDGDVKIRGNDIRDSSGSKTITFDGNANVIIPNELEVGVQAAVTGSIYVRNTSSQSGGGSPTATLYLSNQSNPPAGTAGLANSIRDQFVNDADGRFSSGWTISSVTSGGGGQFVQITSTNVGSQFDFSNTNTVNGGGGQGEIFSAVSPGSSSTFSALKITVMGGWNTIPNGATLSFDVDADGSGGAETFTITFYDVNTNGTDTNGFSSSASTTSYGTTNYINFDHSTNTTFAEGQNGFGFRSDQGNMEYKDLGGSWRQFNTLAVGPQAPDRAIQFNNNGDLGSGNFFYGTNANVGVGDFSNADPDYLFTVQGDKGGSGNNGYVNIVEHNAGTGPGILFQRARGSKASPADIQDDDILGSETYIGRLGGGLQILGGTTTRYHSTNGTNMTFALKGVADSGISNKLFLRDVSLMPHDDTVTSNIGAFVLGAGTNAFGTVYTENIRGPQGTDLKVVADNNDVVMHIGTQGTYANNVGIGISTPEYPLVVEGTHTTEPDAMILNGTTNGPTLSISRKESLVTEVNSGETLSTIKMGVHTSAQLEAINIIAKATTNWDSNISNVSRGTQLVFQTTTGAESNVVTADRMTIDSIKVHCLDDLEVDGDCDIGNGLSVSLASNFGNHVYIDNDMYVNKWISHDTITGRSSGIGSIGTTVELAEYTDGFMNNNPILTFNPNNDDLRVQYRDANGRETFRCDFDGMTYIGTDDGAPEFSAHGYSLMDSGGLYIEGEHNSGSVATIVNRGENDDSDGLRIIIGYGKYGYANDNPTVWYREPVDTNSFLKFSGRSRGSGVTPTGAQYADNFDPDDLFEVGRIAGDGNGGITIIGDTFTGTHDSISSETIQIGMIVESTGELWVSNGISCSLPKTRKTSSKKSKSVFGVVAKQKIENGRADKVPPNFNPYTVNSLGEGKVWITNFDGEPTNGDYITSSPILGCGQLQDDDILHSYTVAKLTEAIDWSSVDETIEHNGVQYKKYLAGCTYHCG